MKRFFSQVFVVVLGMLASLTLLVGLAIWLLQPGQPSLTSQTVLHLALKGRVIEQPRHTWGQLLQGDQETVIDLLALKTAIKQAQSDPQIQGIYLELGSLRAGWASLEEIRNALSAFQKAGKFIIAYGESYTQKTYYLASPADAILMPPASIFPWQGLHQTVFFYKALFDKLAIKPQIFRVGSYKSAVEPFMRQNMSPASRHQSTVLLKAVYDHFLQQVATTRTLKKSSLAALADNRVVMLPQDALQAKLITQIGYADDAENLIRTRLEVAPEAKINYITYGAYASLKKTPASSSQQVAVLVAEGTIVDGQGSPGTIGAQTLAADLRALRENDAVKAIVLRINSPGGSALASDILWKELRLTQAKKPVVASLSDVAASGGYYLAAACDRIIAQPTTITGSIGIFGLFFEIDALLKNKLGITTDVAKVGSSADLLSNPGRPLTMREKNMIQRIIDEGYATFLQRVATGRGLDVKAVAKIASGRVWTGKAAQAQQLVDDLGGLEDAIRAAGELAAIAQDYTVSYWPKPQSLYEQLLSKGRNSRGGLEELHVLQHTIPAWKSIQTLIHMKGIQARLPYDVEID